MKVTYMKVTYILSINYSSDPDKHVFSNTNILFSERDIHASNDVIFSK